MSNNVSLSCTNSLVTIMVVINHRNIPRGPRCLHQVPSPELPTVHEPLMIAPGCSVHSGLLLAIFVRQRSLRRHAAVVPAWFHQRPGPVVSPGGFPGEGMLRPRRPGRMGSPLWLGWVWSGCPIARTEAHQPILHHASSSSCRCGS